MFMDKLLFFLFSIIVFCCGPSNSDNPPRQKEKQVYLSGYDLDHPDEEFLLPEVLTEVSGLEAISDHELATVQDEAGIIFIYDLRLKKVTREIPFVKKGDFEGVAYDGKDYYAISSSGSIYRIGMDGSSEKMNTWMDNSYDVEGLCYDRDKKCLLLCSKALKTVYEFDLQKKELKKEDLLHADKKKFRPSGIAINPRNKKLYLLSGESVRVYNNFLFEGKIDINTKLLPQAEGITFTDNGDMFISSEGQGSEGRVMKFIFKE